MTKYLIDFAYDGINYNGYQRQPKLRTIQGELERALKKINNNIKVEIQSSGRTDAHVHAINQTASFDLSISITPNKLVSAINCNIDNDIYVHSASIVDDNFHARYNVKHKEYIYKINIGDYNPNERNNIYQYNKILDIESMKEAIKEFEGEHDFTAFACQEDIKENRVRTIVKTSIELKDNIVVITFRGTGFLKYQVRNMVGTLISVGEGKKRPSDIKKILDSKDRGKASATAPPEGLYLSEVIY